MSDVIDRPVSDTGPEADSPFRPHTSHWGVFSARWSKGRLEVRPHPDDPDPNRIIENFPGALHHRARLTPGVWEPGKPYDPQAPYAGPPHPP